MLYFIFSMYSFIVSLWTTEVKYSILLLFLSGRNFSIVIKRDRKIEERERHLK